MEGPILAVLAAFVVFAPVAARAALPPYWQSAREITAIVNDGQVHDALKYEVRTERCTLKVKIVDKPAKPGLVGPRQFDIDVGEATCR